MPGVRKIRPSQWVSQVGAGREATHQRRNTPSTRQMVARGARAGSATQPTDDLHRRGGPPPGVADHVGETERRTGMGDATGVRRAGARPAGTATDPRHSKVHGRPGKDRPPQRRVSRGISHPPSDLRAERARRTTQGKKGKPIGGHEATHRGPSPATARTAHTRSGRTTATRSEARIPARTDPKVPASAAPGRQVPMVPATDATKVGDLAPELRNRIHHCHRITAYARRTRRHRQDGLPLRRGEHRTGPHRVAGNRARPGRPQGNTPGLHGGKLALALRAMPRQEDRRRPANTGQPAGRPTGGVGKTRGPSQTTTRGTGGPTRHDRDRWGMRARIGK